MASALDDPTPNTCKIQAGSGRVASSLARTCLPAELGERPCAPAPVVCLNYNYILDSFCISSFGSQEEV